MEITDKTIFAEAVTKISGFINCFTFIFSPIVNKSNITPSSDKTGRTLLIAPSLMPKKSGQYR
jgi:hypothetical protein